MNNTKLIEALEIIKQEYRKLSETPVSAKELTKAKDYIRGKFLIGLEPSDSQASFYAEQELLENKILTPHERLEKINAVTSEQIQEVARDVFRSDRLNLALVGPFKEGDNEIISCLNS